MSFVTSCLRLGKDGNNTAGRMITGQTAIQVSFLISCVFARRELYTECTSWTVPQHTFSSAHTAHSVAQDKVVSASFIVIAHAPSHLVSLMSMLSVPFVPFPSLLSSSSASPSRSTTTVQTCTRCRWLPSSAPASHWTESGRLTDSALNTGYEPNLADFSNYTNTEHTQIYIPDNNSDFRCSDDVIMISGTARGVSNSEALSSSRKAAARKVSFLFGHTSSRETGVGHVSSRSSYREIEAELDREPVATTIFSSQSGGERDRELKFVHALRDRDNLQKILERKVDLAIQEEEETQQKLYQAEAEIEAKIWEKRNRDHSVQEINQDFESQRFRLNQASRWADEGQRDKISLCGQLEL